MYAALAIDRARRAGLATDTKGFEDAVAGLKGTSLAVQAARRLLGLSVIGKVTPGDLSGDKLFFAAIRLAGSSEAESLRKTISLGYVGQKELSTGINSLLADGALYAYR